MLHTTFVSPVNSLRERLQTPEFVSQVPAVDYRRLYNMPPYALIASGSSTLQRDAFGLNPAYSYLHSGGSHATASNPFFNEPPYSGYSGTTMGILPDDVAAQLGHDQQAALQLLEEKGPEAFFNEGANRFEQYHYELIARTLGLKGFRIDHYCSELATGGTESWYTARKWGWGRVLRDGLNGMITIQPINSASKAVEAGRGETTTTKNFLGQTMESGKALAGIAFIPNRPDLIHETLLLSYDSEGDELSEDYHDEEIRRTAAYANENNLLLSLTVTPVNKRGLSNVSIELAKELYRKYPRNVMIVIDDCQGRSDLDWQDLIDNYQAVVLTSFGKSQGVGLGAIAVGNASYFSANKKYFDALETLPGDVIFYTPSVCYYCAGVSAHNTALEDPRLRVIDPSMEMRIRGYLYLQERLDHYSPAVQTYVSERIIELMRIIIRQSSGYLELVEYLDQVRDIINVAVRVKSGEVLRGSDLSLFHYALGTDCTMLVPDEELPPHAQQLAFWGQPETTLDKHNVLRPDHNVAQLAHILSILPLVDSEITWEAIETIEDDSLVAKTIDFALAHFLVQSFQPSIRKANFIARNWSILRDTLKAHMPPKPEKKVYDWRLENRQALARLSEQIEGDMLDLPRLTS